MIKSINYKTMSTSPSDYSCPDGDMQICMNLVNNGNELIPVGTPQKVLNLNKKVVAVHLVGSDRHFILQEGEMFYWCSSDFVLHEIGEISGQIYKVEKIGNTLIFLTDSGMKYYLWKGSYYSYLGDHFPELDLMFALDGVLTTKTYNNYGITIEKKNLVDDVDYSTLIFSEDSEVYDFGADVQYNIELLNNNMYKLIIYGITLYDIKTITLYGYDETLDESVLIYNEDIPTIIPGTLPSDALNPKIYIKPGRDYAYIRLVIVTRNDKKQCNFRIDIYKASEEYSTYRFANTSDNLTNLMAACSEFTSQASKQGKFVYPFFVRYAYRLYDGTISNQSAPCLMYPTFNTAPLIFPNVNITEDSPLTLSAPYCNLQYKLLNKESLSLIKDNWSDIIKEIVFYVSSPIYSVDFGATFSPSENRVKIVAAGNMDQSVYSVSRIQDASGTSIKDYGRHYLVPLITDSIGASTKTDYILIPPSFTDAQNIESVTNTYTFYEIKKISPSNLKSDDFTTIPIEQDYLTSLNTRDTCPDDYKSHNTFIPEISFVFNSRLIIASIKENLFKGFNPVSMSTYGKSVINDGTMTIMYASLVYINTDQGIKKVYSPNSLVSAGDLYWFYYPDQRAFKAKVFRIIRNQDSTVKTYISEIDLISHDFLNGSYWYGGGEIMSFEEGSISSETDSLINQPNMLYTSSVNNPFYFPASGMESIDGNIVGLSSAVTALSQGQYGDFPLYAFTDKGIWALSPNSEGTFVAKQPIPREVCNNPASITQIDNAVVFSSDKGLMWLSGATCVCLSSVFDNSVMQVSLPGITNFYQGNINIDFIEFLKSAKIAYDYAHQRLVIFQPEGNTFLYSLSSKSFTMLDRAYSSIVQNYPECYVMDSQNNLLNLSVENQDDVSFFILSRPFQLSNHLTTIRQLIQRGLFKDLKMVLYGSRDFKNWFVIASSSTNRMGGFSGTPYRTFRILISGNMEYSHAISELGIEFVERETNRFR